MAFGVIAGNWTLVIQGIDGGLFRAAPKHHLVLQASSASPRGIISPSDGHSGLIEL